ncbi:GNAT family N-acetyltransferase [Devosia sp.]|uniref:GNAT family N-acetyltransferase n=1 Tax=Devosia sp. TaxID=1871048 RepID=UPI003A8F039E
MKTLKTDRLILRNFQPGDAAALFDYLHAPTASCFFALRLADLGAAETEALKRSCADDYIAVCLAQTGQLLGDLSAHRDPKWPEDADGQAGSDTLSVGWNFNPRFGGKGYAFEAAHALCADLFANQGARRLYAYVEDHNTPSRRLCQKLGMREEGLFREYVTFHSDSAGQPIYENTLQYAILRHEWQAAARV